MSARRSPVERDARKLAAASLDGARGRSRENESAYDVFENAVRARELATVWAVQRGDIPAARREARAVQLLSEAQARMVARQGRDAAAELAALGIVPGARVVVVHAGYGDHAAPVGTVLTLEDDTRTHFPHGTDDDGRRWSVYSGHIEVVPDAPIQDSRIEEPMPHDVVERAEQRLMDQGYADDEDMVESPMPHDDEYGDGPPVPEGAEVFECDRDGCDYAIGAVGVPAFDEDPDVFNDEIREHIRGHQRDDEWDTDDECEGHESLDGAHMGVTAYCDGTCRTMRIFT